ncbi:nucleotidyltransferase family protein [Parasphingorhabdus cellanae]|uniref:Nucleotidyltransferase family protein n=1 Tax=Parasphingorhabdus cellanae TaxID=2806553 RepID=A0ABX7T6M3_9SPHN|nr:nucleotidyltransferase family protein [Parasphingorhabdus cellanae]QTD56114.1 nucleotidyltransferase family protein [Parasphingorhabdus cellanae]
MSKVETAMVMAAGLGKRMRPLTATRPKPLVKVAGKAMIDHTLDKLWEAGVMKVVVNAHYLPDALEAHLKAVNYPFDIRISDERAQLMETGGGMVQAAPLIDEDRFFAINSDNLWTDGPTNSLQRLEERWDDAEMDALLLLVPQTSAHNYKGAGDFKLDDYGRVSRRLPDRQAPFIYTGIQLLSKRLLRDAPDGPFSTNILWSRAIEEGRLYGLVHEGDWFEVGSPEAIAPTEAALRRV